MKITHNYYSGRLTGVLKIRACVVEVRRRRRRRRLLFISFLIADGSLGAITESRAYDVLAYAFTNVYVRMLPLLPTLICI